MYLVYLNNYHIRQCEAQYLSVMYEILGKNLPAHFILPKEYLKKYEKGERWEVKWVENHWGKYADIISRLKFTDYTLMKKPEDLLKEVEVDLAPSEILKYVVDFEVPTQVETIIEVLRKKGRNIRAGLSWVNNKCFKETLNKFNIPAIFHELGPFRPQTYIPTAYLDFSGVNGNTEFDERFNEFLKISHEVPILSRKELIRVISPNHYQELYRILDNKDRKYDIGVGLQVEVDTNLLLFNNGYSWVDPVLAAKADSTGKVLVRPHPMAGYVMKPDNRLEIDDITKGSAVEFINKCNKIYCLNSSVGFEAIMLGREARIFGDSPFRNVCNMDEETKLKALNFAVFGYLIHRDLLFKDSYYDFRLAHRGDEKGIYLDNMQRLLKNAKGIKF